ncbi:GNAT family N-acetyltransferase [Paenibacillus sp. MMS18-CY102]|uniref:GNAT family N-acetyltransferase n=1 Tax=Paenibacillus sp. MMS18-CY102 TaxID=2682849 RepID=UPI001365BD59|nr:GNAT family N-acetyltransferase [Paenibacillus sp. MMS18-CY102]MWC29804.1 GNAT family N-acetyltransferase [Paenibacillus sp. MMS18-CY102]
MEEPKMFRRAIEESLAAYQISIARLPGGNVREDNRMLLVSSGVPLPFYNGVFRSCLNEGDADRQIAEVIQYFGGLQLPFYWQLGQSHCPADLDQRLLSQGFHHDETMPGMAMRLGELNPACAIPEGFEFHAVRDEEQLKQWVHVWAFGAADAIPMCEGALGTLGVGDDKPWQYFLGYIDNKPVATAMLFYNGEVAALHWVVTLPEYRKIGVGTAMTVTALNEARKEGFKIAILTASQEGYHIYKKVGFSEYCMISNYVFG